MAPKPIYKLLAALGFVLVLAGVAGFVVGGVTITREDTHVKLGSFSVKGDVERFYPFPKWACAIAVLGGVGLIVVGLRGRVR